MCGHKTCLYQARQVYLPGVIINKYGNMSVTVRHKATKHIKVGLQTAVFFCIEPLWYYSSKIFQSPSSFRVDLNIYYVRFLHLKCLKPPDFWHILCCVVYFGYPKCFQQRPNPENEVFTSTLPHPWMWMFASLSCGIVYVHSRVDLSMTPALTVTQVKPLCEPKS